MKTPVAFLIFNRPDTTEQVFEAIRRARPEMLLVVADGPRADRPGEAAQCAAVRAVIDRVDWPCTVLKNYSDINLGCKLRVATGLDWVFHEVEEAIILEDDCLPHPDFFPFCELMLDRYRDDARVMMVGGTNYLLDTLQVRESYIFSRYYPIWGWATWRRAWRHYDIAMNEWPRLRREGGVKAYYSQRFMRKHITGIMDLAYQGRVNTWDIQWFYSCLFNDGLNLVPRVNMISNIGTDGAHSSHSTVNHFLPVQGLDMENLVHPEQVHPHYPYDQAFFSMQFKTSLVGLLQQIPVFVRKRMSRRC